MKHWIAILASILMQGTLLAQSGVGGGGQSNVSGGQLVQAFAGVPSGACGANALAVNTTNGNLYSCNASVWTAVGGAGSSAWSALTASANTNTGNFSSSQPGTFTNLAMNENWLFTNTGGGSCSTANILAQTGSQTVFLTDVIATCLNIPAGTGVTNGFSNGFGAYVLNNNASSSGFFGFGGGVGYYSQVGCIGGSATLSKCWGANFSVYDLAVKPATLFGNEYDITVNNTTTTGAGNIFSFRGTAQPTADNFPMVQAQTATGTGRFTAGFETQAGSMASGATNAYAAVNIGPQETGNAQDSQQIFFNATAGASPISASIHLLQDNVLAISDRALVMLVGHGAGSESYGIALKATATLTQNQLVKIDTANSDSVVSCLTTDTICHGFVQASTVYCNIGGNFCGINTVPGSLATGVLGTGTCAIGNNVIVDTTTNGRIKCTASQPGVGAWIGIALSAQAVVGNNVDILTKFQ